MSHTSSKSKLSSCSPSKASCNSLFQFLCDNLFHSCDFTITFPVPYLNAPIVKWLVFFKIYLTWYLPTHSWKRVSLKISIFDSAVRGNILILKGPASQAQRRRYLGPDGRFFIMADLMSECDYATTYSQCLAYYFEQASYLFQWCHWRDHITSNTDI